MKILIIVVSLIIIYFVTLQSGLLARLSLVTKAPDPLKEAIKKLPGQEFNLDPKKAKIDLNKLRQGCPVKDCIPAIDNPKFISAGEAEQKNQIEDNDVVFAISHKGINRTYPQRILNWHEIVNDEVAGTKVAVTFCPLCGTAIGFERPSDTTFGVSGKLVNSNLVMYDRKTQTLWQQLGGEAIVGELVGQKLKLFPIDTLLWKDWKKLHPDTQVLSQDTGYSRDYSFYPYGSYEQDRDIYFPAEGEQDNRLHPKAIVWGISINNQSKAYSDEKLAQVGELTEKLANTKLTIKRTKEGQVIITKDDGQRIIPERSMWFAWLSFHKDTELFK